MSDFHHDSSDYELEARRNYNDDRFSQLNGLLSSSTASTWSYLLAVNGGAAAGTLAFIGARTALAQLQWPYVVLAIFTTGFLFVGFAHAFIVHKLQALIELWVTNAGRYWRNEIPWSRMVDEDNRLVKSWAWVPWVLGWAALASFLSGVIVAALNFRALAVA